jgi:predicted nucleotidyltransferase
MSNDRLRHAIAFEAARLMYDRTESEYFTAKRKAAKRLCRQSVKPSDLPSNAEIREMVQTFARLHEGEKRTENLRAMRLAALRMMRLLRRFRPRLIGSVLTGHVRAGSDIDIHVFCDHPEGIESTLEAEGYQYDLERKQITKHQETRTFTHIHIPDKHPFELTVYAEDKAHYVFKSSITGKAIERVSIAELEQFLEKEYPDLDLNEEALDLDLDDDVVDSLLVFQTLLEPLEKVKQSPKYHPEGDVLYHLLQVFELAKNERPYDEEFLIAALLHDVGKGINPYDHVNSGLEAVEGLVTERTEFLIANHMVAHEYRSGKLGHRQRVNLEASEHLEDLLLLSELDQQGRVAGVQVGTVKEAIQYLRDLRAENG